MMVRIFCAFLMTVACVVCFSCSGGSPGPKVSRFGEYGGYSVQRFDGSKRSSDFLMLSDGTKLAYDLFLPVNGKIVAAEPLPALFLYTPYGRAWTVFDEKGKFTLAGLDLPWYFEPLLRFKALMVPGREGKIMDAISRSEWLGDLVKYGYAVIVVDRPGTGASYGRLVMHPETAAVETSEIIDWIAAQSWSDGNVGMFGDSIQAQIQFQAASTGNPHLKAILPATTWMDNYGTVMFPGGIPNKAFAALYAKLNDTFDGLATPVDSDADGSLLARLREERAGSHLAKSVAGVDQVPFRDALTPNDGQDFWAVYHSLYPLLDRINGSDTAVYLIDGWYDLYALDDLRIYQNLKVPKRLMIRPVDHSGIDAPGVDVNFGAEAHRWFDYWLKGIDNGIMDEEPIHYYLQASGKKDAWRGTAVWPPEPVETVRFYLAEGNGNRKVSVNDGSLSSEKPAGIGSSDRYTVDYTTTSGKKSRWTSLAVPRSYPNMNSNDAKALTWTLPLAKPLDVVGHPVVRIRLRTAAPDLDLVAYLEEVDRAGNSTYVSQGSLRATHRALSVAPFENFNLPWHDHFRSGLLPVPPDEPIELVFDLLPTAYRFGAGKSLRLTVAFADADNFQTPVIDPPPVVEILSDVEHPSCLDLQISR